MKDNKRFEEVYFKELLELQENFEKQAIEYPSVLERIHFEQSVTEDPHMLRLFQNLAYSFAVAEEAIKTPQSNLLSSFSGIKLPDFQKNTPRGGIVRIIDAENFKTAPIGTTLLREDRVRFTALQNVVIYPLVMGDLAVFKDNNPLGRGATCIKYVLSISDIALWETIKYDKLNLYLDAPFEIREILLDAIVNSTVTIGYESAGKKVLKKCNISGQHLQEFSYFCDSELNVFHTLYDYSTFIERFMFLNIDPIPWKEIESKTLELYIEFNGVNFELLSLIKLYINTFAVIECAELLSTSLPFSSDMNNIDIDFTFSAHKTSRVYRITEVSFDDVHGNNIIGVKEPVDFILNRDDKIFWRECFTPGCYPVTDGKSFIKTEVQMNNAEIARVNIVSVILTETSNINGICQFSSSKLSSNIGELIYLQPKLREFSNMSGSEALYWLNHNGTEFVENDIFNKIQGLFEFLNKRNPLILRSFIKKIECKRKCIIVPKTVHEICDLYEVDIFLEKTIYVSIWLFLEVLKLYLKSILSINTGIRFVVHTGVEINGAEKEIIYDDFYGVKLTK